MTFIDEMALQWHASFAKTGQIPRKGKTQNEEKIMAKAKKKERRVIWTNRQR
jgi:hypothetical protein